MKSSKKITEGVFSMADQFVADFFDSLKKGAADQIIKKAEKSKLPPAAIEHMKKLEQSAKEFKEFLKKL